MHFHRYRAELDRNESEVIRRLRRRGFAIALFGPKEVGSPLNRGSVEGAMVRAGKASLKEKQETQT